MRILSSPRTTNGITLAGRRVRCVTPDVNLVLNVSLGAVATPTLDGSNIANMPVTKIGDVHHPVLVVTAPRLDERCQSQIRQKAE